MSKVHHGNNVYRVREKSKITAEELAAKLGDGWNKEKVEEMERQQTIDDETLNKIGPILYASVDALKELTLEKQLLVIQHEVITQVESTPIALNLGVVNNYNTDTKIIKEAMKMFEQILNDLRKKIG